MSKFSMKCGKMLGGLVSVLIATSAPASADDDKVKAVTRAVVDLLFETSDLEDPKQSAGLDTFEGGGRTNCMAVVAEAKAAGLAGDARFYPYGKWSRANARTDDKDNLYVTLDDLPGFCKEYDRAVIQEWAEAAVVSAFYIKSDTFKAPIEGMYPSEAERVIKSGEACTARVDAALAAGFTSKHVLSAPTHKVEVKLGDAKGEYCQPVLDWGKKRLADINGAAGAKQDEIAAVYAAVGIKGDRLKLFSSIGLPDNSGFLAPGCVKYVDTAKGLAKAKKLFTWFESDDGSIVVTKYTFKGNKYKESEKRYSTKARAYKGCK